MAETLVLAELQIDSSGVISGIAAVDKAFGLGERRTREFGRTASDTSKGLDLFTNRMFSMKNAITAALGGFTIAGAIITLKNMATEILHASDAWESFAASSAKAQKSFGSLVADVTGVTAALKDTSAWMERINAASEAGKAAGYEGPSTMGVIGYWLFGGSLPLIKGALASIGGWLDARLGTNKPEKFGPPAPAGYGNAGYNPDGTPIERFGPEGPSGYGNDTSTRYINGRLVRVKAATRIFDNELAGTLNDITYAFEGATIAIDEATRALGGFRDEGEDIVELPIKKKVDDTEDSFNGAAAATFAFAAGLQSVAEGGLRSINSFLGQMIVSVGQAIVAWGAALAVKSYFTQDYGGVAAGIGFMALGASTIAIGSAMSHNGGGGGGGGEHALAAAGPGGSSFTGARITVINEGTMIGNTPDQIVRWITEAQRRSGER